MNSARAHVKNACDEGEHELVYRQKAKARICEKCGLSAQSIANWLGHDLD